MHGAQNRLSGPTGATRAVGLIGLLMLVGCGNARPGPTSNPARGKLVINRHACGSCHWIAGVAEANGTVGPPLSHFGSQQMIAGALPNSPDNLTRYLLSPESVVKGNVMPNQHLTGGDARDAAAYLLTLR
ncbi:c-type cytochrome [Sphingomonas oligoaromativorans]|jgi:cytochrome c2|uniref:c-type cytochrome n=1 Tax=Sphingomonas oligoaromativorans TaxID=575322 RepID=UPI001423DFE7|nr:c-type cytochrome [Sphingomonas oligoaromativorans]NIJ33377.1 cytochrome c2 [Sphingomonas oligoaromativorans]